MNGDEPWVVTNTRFDAHSLGQHNSVFAISNGYLGLKGNLQEDRDGSQPVTLLNGVYDELDMFGLIRPSNQERRYLDPRYFDTAGRSPAVANLPNPLSVRVYVADREVSFSRGTVSRFVQSLDLSCGLYRYAYDVRDAGGHAVRIEMQRFASMCDCHRVYMRYSVTPLTGPVRIVILSGIDGNTVSNTTGERQYGVVEWAAGTDEACSLHARTFARKHDVYVGVADVPRAGPMPSSVCKVVEHNAVHRRYEFAPGAGQTITLDRCIVLACSEDNRHGVAVDPRRELSEACRRGFDAALAAQRKFWEGLWGRADVRIEGDDLAQRYLRFCLYHLLAAAPRHTDQLSVPVKLLSGEYYQGNTFYDTDVCIVPFYMLTFPPWARTCLNWRYVGLEPGRQIARDLGYRGAKFAWQAGPYGEECLGPWWRFTHTNIHVNGDVAYALMQYCGATGDEGLLRERGVDVLVETARFLASRACHDAARDAYDLRDVAGPDEGHCESTNNFYTNYLAIRNLRWAAEVLDHLRSSAPDAYASCVARLVLEESEPALWRRVADRLTLLFDPGTRLYEQCEGFYGLQPMPGAWARDRQTWFETVFPYQALNQPDVLMAMVLFRDDFAAEVRRANWEFYRNKSMNFSSMSFAFNSILAADVGQMEDAYRHFLVSAGMDLDEELTGRKDTYAGLHGTAAGGAWMAAVFGFGGVCLSERGLRIEPHLPPQWEALHFRLAYRGCVLSVSIDRDEVVVTSAEDGPGPVTLRVGGDPVTLTPGASWRSRKPG